MTIIGRYTEHPDPAVDRAIQEKLDAAREVILAELPQLDALLLAGSYGRGEGSFRWRGDRLEPLKDFDLVGLAHGSIPEADVHRAMERAEAVLNQGAARSLDEYRFRSFVVDLMIMRPEEAGFPDLFFVDLPASHLLWSKDGAVPSLALPRRVPVSSGLRLVFEKVQGLVAFGTPELFAGTMGPKDLEKLNYECHKAYVEMGTALTVLDGSYQPSYRSRLDLVPAALKRFPTFEKAIPGLQAKIARGTDYKLRTWAVEDRMDGRAMWEETRVDVLAFLRCYLEEGYGLPSALGWSALAPRALDTLRPVYFLPLVEELLERKAGRTARRLAPLFNLGYHWAGNAWVGTQAAEVTGRPYLRPALSLHAPPLKTFLASATLLAAWQGPGQLDPQLAQAASRMYGSVAPAPSAGQDWAALRAHALRAYNLYRGRLWRK